MLMKHVSCMDLLVRVQELIAYLFNTGRVCLTDTNGDRPQLGVHGHHIQRSHDFQQSKVSNEI